MPHRISFRACSSVSSWCHMGRGSQSVYCCDSTPRRCLSEMVARQRYQGSISSRSFLSPSGDLEECADSTTGQHIVVFTDLPCCQRQQDGCRRRHVEEKCRWRWKPCGWFSPFQEASCWALQVQDALDEEPWPYGHGWILQATQTRRRISGFKGAAKNKGA